MGAIIGYGTFAVIYWGYRILRHKEGLGYGDVKFLAALGARHTWTFLPDWFSLLPHSLAEP